jgi:hypothetical protein
LGTKFEYSGGKVGQNHKERKNMKPILVSILCTLVAPLAFAQVSTTTTKETTVAQPVTTTETTTTYTAGTVTTYEPGKTIVVREEKGGPARFALGTAARIVNKAGNVVTTALTPGEHVRVYYSGTGETRVVDHVVVED